VVRKCIEQLLNDPGTARMYWHVEAYDSPPIVGNGRHNAVGLTGLALNLSQQPLF
jgi:hypothetical protein